jgi:hypothetical protein
MQLAGFRAGLTGLAFLRTLDGVVDLDAVQIGVWIYWTLGTHLAFDKPLRTRARHGRWFLRIARFAHGRSTTPNAQSFRGSGSVPLAMNFVPGAGAEWHEHADREHQHERERNVGSLRKALAFE